MAGEKSKKSGEFGEEIVRKLLTLIGWSDPLSGYDIPCRNGKYHSTTEGERKNHGIDFSYNYESMLITNRQESNIISVKYRDKYPASPTTDFKNFLIELAFTIECFRYHEQFQQSINTNIDSKNINGIIFWLSRDEKHTIDIIDKIKDFRMTESVAYGPIYLVDNLRASFIYSVVKKCESLYKNNFQFVYQTTGANISSLNRKTFGKMLPIENINSPVLLVKGTTRSDEILNIFCIDQYSDESLRRLVGLARDVTEQWASKIIIYFSKYRRLENENSVNTVKALFVDKELTEKVKVKNLSINSFRELENDDE